MESHTTYTNKKARWYECFADSGEIRCGRDLEEVKWVDKAEVLGVIDERIKSFWPEKIRNYFLL